MHEILPLGLYHRQKSALSYIKPDDVLESSNFILAIFSNSKKTSERVKKFLKNKLSQAKACDYHNLKSNLKVLPVILDASKLNSLIVGYGSVGRRKKQTLEKAGVEKIKIIDPKINRKFVEKDLKNKNLVIISTSDILENERIKNLCKEKQIMWNLAGKSENREDCIIFPGIIRKEDFLCAIFTGKPKLTRKLRQKIEKTLESF